jgi:antitoxin FitA
MDISLKTLSDTLAERLKRRAESHNRTPEDEALVILEDALCQEKQSTGPAAVAEAIRKLGLRTPSESVDIIRQFRDR